MNDGQTKNASSDGRQKITAAIFLVVMVVVIWQVYGMFKSSPAPKPSLSNNMNAMQQANQMQPMQATLKPKTEEMTAREKELLAQQSVLQAKYISALNELQMLKIQSDIATTNKNIMKEKFDTVKAQKDIVDLLSPPVKPAVTPGQYAQGLVTPGGPNPFLPPGAAGSLDNSKLKSAPPAYLLISITRLHDEWGAVLGYDGKLYQVAVGDVLPTDGAKVMEIDNDSLTLEDKAGKQTKYSMVPII